MANWQVIKYMLKRLLLLLFTYKSRKRLIKEAPKKILILRWHKKASIGDTIIITALLREIKVNFPQVQLDILAGPENGELLKTSNRVNNFFTLQKIHLKYLPLMFRIRQNRYDVVLDCSDRINTSYLLLVRFLSTKTLVGIEKWEKYGLNTKNLKMYDYVLPSTETDHFVDIYLRFLELYSIKPQNRNYELIIDLEKSSKELTTFIDQNKDRKIIYFNQFASDSWKSLNEEYCHSLITKLLNKIPNEYLIILGFYGEKNKTICKKIVSEIDSSNLRMSPTTTNVFDLMYLIQHVNSILSVDTSIIHFGSAFNKPMIALYNINKLYTNRFAPTSSHHYQIVTPVENKMEAIDQGEVVKSFVSLINSTK